MDKLWTKGVHTVSFREADSCGPKNIHHHSRRPQALVNLSVIKDVDLFEDLLAKSGRNGI